jgi:hypothetical protein
MVVSSLFDILRALESLRKEEESVIPDRIRAQRLHAQKLEGQQRQWRITSYPGMPHFREKFKLWSAKAGRILGCPPETNPVDFFLTLLYKDLLSRPMGDRASVTLGGRFIECLILEAERFWTRYLDEFEERQVGKMIADLPDWIGDHEQKRRAAYELCARNSVELLARVDDPHTQKNSEPSAAREKTNAQAESEKSSVVAERERILSEYKAATGNPSNKLIYEADNSPIHKPEFYDWVKGDLKAASATCINFERFLRDKQPPIKKARIA